MPKLRILFAEEIVAESDFIHLDISAAEKGAFKPVGCIGMAREVRHTAWNTAMKIGKINIRVRPSVPEISDGDQVEVNYSGMWLKIHIKGPSH